MGIALLLLASFIVLTFLPSDAQKLRTFQFGPFNATHYQTFEIKTPAPISNGALQVTPDSAGNFTLDHQSGRVLFNQPFKLWQGNPGLDPASSLGSNGKTKVASFNTSFFINIFRLNNSSTPGEGLAFIIAPDTNLPPGSSGEYLRLTNSSTDGNSSKHLVAIEFDTYKQDFNPDDNHIGLDINGVRSNKTVSLSNFGFQLAPNGTKFFHVWVQYDGSNKSLEVYIVDEDDKKPTKPMPSKPIMTANLDISTIVSQSSYFGFSASTGNYIELNCVLGWNLTVEELPKDEDASTRLVVALAAGVPVAVILLMGSFVGFLVYQQRKAGNDPIILKTLKSLPGAPRDFRFKDLKKATNNFDDKHKLGEGGFGVVYRGFLTKENLEVAVKKFSRDNIKSKDDFLAELTIINRLRHKHLVKLLGWCHTNEVLLLVYEYMPNRSLDKHIFCGPGRQTLTWNLRFKILTSVASALHYLHNEYDQKVLHCDLKASNILLDSNFNARLGDFGLARAIDHEKTSYAELDGMPGTPGYIAPECLHTRKATNESDVYSFGAVLLEVVSGLRPSWTVEGFHSVVDWIWFLHRDGRILEAVDGRLGEDYVVEEAERVLLLGLACSHPIAAKRPKTHVIGQILAGTVASPHVRPFKPAFVWPAMSPLSLNVYSTAKSMSMTSSSQSGSGWTLKNVSRESEYGYSMDNSIV